MCFLHRQERMPWMALRGVLLHKMWMNSNSCDSCYVSICSPRSMKKSLLFIFKYNSYWHALIKMHASVWRAFVGTHFIISPKHIICWVQLNFADCWKIPEYIGQMKRIILLLNVVTWNGYRNIFNILRAANGRNFILIHFNLMICIRKIIW